MFPVLRKLCFTLFLVLSVGANAAIVDPKLQAAMSSAGPAGILSAIVTYNAQPTAADVAALKAIGIKSGLTLKKLPMVGVWGNTAQLNKIAAQPNVQSLYLNSKLKYFNREANALASATQQRTMPGFGYKGRGVTVAVIDSGIDATHPDLQLGANVKQNAKMLINGKDLDMVRISGVEPDYGLLPPVWVENVPNTDITCGHGTHCAGTIGGTGVQSGGKHMGVAPEASLIGVSSGESIVVLWALAAFDYVLANQDVYKIRVVSNSWGSGGLFDENDPINQATRIMHGKGMVVVFAMGNSGPGSNTQNPYAVAPWVIGVAAADKKAKLAGFSSRGIKDDPIHHPTITATGVSVVSARAKGTALGAVSGDIADDPNLPAEEIPWYCHLSGTSMSTPVVSGCIALMLEANPSLYPDRVKQILRTTATRMVGYQEHEVGAGHVNVLAAIDMAKTKKSYGDVLSQTFHAKFTGSMTKENFSQTFDPTLPPPSHSYKLGANGIQSDVFIQWESDLNTFNLGVTDPSGTVTATGSNLLWLLDGLRAGLSFSYPAAGDWRTTVWGLRGQSSGTTGIGVPDAIHGEIVNYYGTFTGLTDIDRSPFAAAIRRAVSMRLMDGYPDGTFRPSTPLTRYMTAKLIASNAFVRQNQVAPVAFTDVSGSILPYVSAVTSPGGPLRDTFGTNGPIMTGVSATTFGAGNKVTRAELAIWLVKALGLEADAQSNKTTATTFTDDAQIPAHARGYVVVANNLGLINGYVNAGTIPGAPPTYSWRPGATILRGEMAAISCRWHDLYMQ